MRYRRALLPFLACCLLSARVVAGEVSVAAAANFGAPLQVIADAFAARSGHSVRISSASSGKLYAQILHGAPFDLFLSADTDKPAALVESGEAVEDSRFTYAIGRLALWSDERDAQPRDRLEAGHFKRLAIANPRLAPYGVAAQETLQNLGLWPAVRDKLVSGENIAQTWQFVASGNAELGFVALSQVIEHGATPASVWVVPKQLHAPIRQDLVLLARSAKKKPALELLAFLHTPEAAAIIRGYGYDTEP